MNTVTKNAPRNANTNVRSAMKEATLNTVAIRPLDITDSRIRVLADTG